MIASTASLEGTRASTSAACAHCGFDVPPGLIDAGAEQFCCSGCRTAYEIIHGCGLDRFYALRDEHGAPRPVEPGGRRYEEMDDPAFLRRHASGAAGGAYAIELFLEGVHCAACVWLVERLPRIVPGVIESRLDLGRSMVRVAWDPARAPLSRIARALAGLGYPPHPARGASSREARRAEDRRALARIGLAGACAGNVMLLAIALYAGVFDGMEPRWRALFRWTSMGLSVVSLLGPGMVFFRGAWGAVRTRTPHMDVPIAVGLGAGGVLGVVNTVLGRGEVYFDSLSVLVLALLAGRWIQARQRRNAADAVELMFSLTPSSARRVEGEDVVEVPIESVVPGDVLEVRAGDSVPVDGDVVVGASEIDESLLTGESRPATVGAGDRVSAGTINLSAPIRVIAHATGENTRAGRLMRLVEEGAARRPRAVRLADRVAGQFVGFMLAAAALTLGAWLLIDPGHAVDHAVALLIVTCPCALGLSTPLAASVAIGRAARRGILVKAADAVERLEKPGLLLLDKTGTLTRGRLAVQRWRGPEWVKGVVCAAEAASSHPAALALVRDLGAPPARGVGGVEQIGGKGIRATHAGTPLVIGSASFVRVSGAAITGAMAEEEAWCVRDGLTPILVAIDGRVEAVAGIGDPIRDDSEAAIERWRRAGWRVGVLSGDHPEIVSACGRSLGLDPALVRGGLTPEDKLAAVRAAAMGGPVVMVGDGVNDAAALAEATVGIAVHGGAEASLAAADIYLGRGGLGPLAEVLDGSRRTMRVIRRNFAVAIAYNLLAGGLAACGAIGPLLAAILMPASSLSVLALSLKARTFGGAPWR